MLQASTNDRKTKAEASSKTAEHLPEQEQPTYLPGWMRLRQTQSFQQHKNLKALHKTYGNQAMLRMMHKLPVQTFVSTSPLSRGGILQRKCACGNTAGSLGSCAECQEDGEMVVPGSIQTKLTINEPGDRYEQEADRVAEQVLAAPTHSTLSDTIPRIQRFAGQTTRGANMAAPASVERVLSSPGSPLEVSLQQDMERRFGHNFSSVRVHTNEIADRSAREVNANTYTVGHNIVFRAGQYAPRTHEGRQLITHELTHTIQQNAVRNLGADSKQEQLASAGGRLVQRDGEFNVLTLDELYNNALQTARQTGNWQDVAEKLNGFNHEDIQSHLAELTDDEVELIYQGALDNPRVGPQSQVALLTKLDIPRASTIPPTSTQMPPVLTDTPVNVPSPAVVSKPISDMTSFEKLIEAFNRAKINAAVREKILSLVTAQALVEAIIAFAVTFVFSQLTPVGWAANIGIALTGIFIGSALFTAIKHLIRFADARNATTPEELDQAGAEFAQAIAELEVDAIILLVMHGVGGGPKGGASLEEASTVKVSLGVTPDGRIIPVLAETVPDTISTAASAELGVKAAVAATALLSTGSGSKIGDRATRNGPYRPEPVRPPRDIKTPSGDTVHDPGFEGRRFDDPWKGIQRKSIFKLNKFNLQEMLEGRPPVGEDGKKVQLHHRAQQPNGPLDELTATEHQKLSRFLHDKDYSDIDRKLFDEQRARYWVTRSRDLLKID